MRRSLDLYSNSFKLGPLITPDVDGADDDVLADCGVGFGVCRYTNIVGDDGD